MTAKILVVLLVLSACAPPPGESRDGATDSDPWIPPSHELVLLRSEIVATELHLGAEVRKAAESGRPCRQAIAAPVFWGEFGSCPHPSGGCPADIAATLPPETQDRLEQIRLQVAGGMALLESKLATTLALSDEQHSRLAATKEEIEREVAEAVSRMRFSSQEAMNHFIRTYAYRRPVSDRLLSVLTDDQRKKLNEMYGPKFDVDAYLREKGVPQ